MFSSPWSNIIYFSLILWNRTNSTEVNNKKFDFQAQITSIIYLNFIQRRAQNEIVGTYTFIKPAPLVIEIQGIMY